MQPIEDQFIALRTALERAGLTEHATNVRQAELALASSATEHCHSQLEFDCYGDEDERVAYTLEEYVRAAKLVVGDEFEVTACFTRTERYRIAGGGPTIHDPHAPFQFAPAEPDREDGAAEHQLVQAAESARDDLSFLTNIAHWGRIRFGNPNPFTTRVRAAMRRIRRSVPGDPAEIRPWRAP
ncbi:hypothetical protein [Burkholderia vietnamiensis]|uniref:hypothetical protein n=1 Tax=Burkholderia vietnamiensis TaxID=60552 RepID=UPI000ADA5ABF|nr:hypothetical protein [Burkholderia vietnamiensis]MBR8189186.1 hypothetical protein [Burkholderia vietnamiensis]HDR9174393.1 hypothetical protein [Burkholderia vietnamiensis]